MAEKKAVRNIDMVKKIGTGSVSNIFSRNWRKIAKWFLILAIYPMSIFIAFTFGLAWGKYELRLLIDGNISEIYSREVPEERIDSVDFEPFWKAWTLLDQRFVGFEEESATSTPSTDQDRVWGAIQGLTASYGDPFTSFLPPEENELFEADISGEFSGVGMEIGNRDGYLTVTSPLPGTPAARAGMKAQDIISKIDGVDSLKMPVEQAVKLIRGPKGESVTLEVLRSGSPEPLEITIIRDVISIPTIETGIIGNAFVIKLYSFTAKSPLLFRDAVQEFIESQKGVLVLDLRNNPGGFLEAAVSISSWFLSEDKLVVEEDYGGKQENNPHYSKGYNAFNENLRMVIVTNKGSASASEIVAGALRDHDRALLVGETTFGKGSVQELFNLTGDTSLKVTIAKWLTPSGDHITEDGIEVDIVIEEQELEEESDNGTYNQDLSQDQVIQNAIEIAEREDFKQLFDKIPESLVDKYKTIE